MLEVKLPWPHKSLFPNAKGGRHWGAFQVQKEKARTVGFMLMKSALGAHEVSVLKRVPLHITFYAPDRRRRDVDGMHGAIKHHLDGMAKALGVDDSVFRPVTLDVGLDPAKQGYVIVEVGHA
ncbi:hypothetical protein PAEH1_02735 [Paenalcaligenes hominis]|uniref:Uncharacterized protein n=1 Tax=Paenalcaligenes hominis TaxID=643674 RepID=A0A1U9JYA7_9BURK|nr:hypothetical protein [Paenalcaligenes hominis]AQS50741.1 hypothetical protein PAEH1_02735 [Paenalcaligenes hominis]